MKKKWRFLEMKNRVSSLLLAIVLCVVGVVSINVKVNAEVPSEDVELSVIETDDALIGYSQNQTWGVYLSDGYSVINRMSSTKVGAGGVTNANRKCTVQVNAILERKTSSGSWARVTSWLQTNENAYSVVISKSVTVSTGSYYRVRSYHYAGSDTASSSTDALYM
jgi:hypothetical protein